VLDEGPNDEDNFNLLASMYHDDRNFTLLNKGYQRGYFNPALPPDLFSEEGGGLGLDYAKRHARLEVVRATNRLDDVFPSTMGGEYFVKAGTF